MNYFSKHEVISFFQYATSSLCHSDTCVAPLDDFQTCTRSLPQAQPHTHALSAALVALLLKQALRPSDLNTTAEIELGGFQGMMKF